MTTDDLDKRKTFTNEILEEIIDYHPYFFLDDLPEDWSESEFNRIIVSLCDFMYDVSSREYMFSGETYFTQVCISNVYHPTKEKRMFYWVSADEYEEWWLIKDDVDILRKYGWQIESKS